MPKSKSPTIVKLKPPEDKLRALIKKRNQERFDQLASTTKANGGIAGKLAKLINLNPENIPADLLRDFKAAAGRAHGKSPAKAASKGRR